MIRIRNGNSNWLADLATIKKWATQECYNEMMYTRQCAACEYLLKEVDARIAELVHSLPDGYRLVFPSRA